MNLKYLQSLDKTRFSSSTELPMVLLIQGKESMCMYYLRQCGPKCQLDWSLHVDNYQSLKISVLLTPSVPESIL